MQAIAICLQTSRVPGFLGKGEDHLPALLFSHKSKKEETSSTDEEDTLDVLRFIWSNCVINCLMYIYYISYFIFTLFGSSCINFNSTFTTSSTESANYKMRDIINSLHMHTLHNWCNLNLWESVRYIRNKLQRIVYKYSFISVYSIFILYKRVFRIDATFNCTMYCK